MGFLEQLHLRLVVVLLLTKLRLAWFFQGLFGTRPYYTHFPPDRSFSIASSTSSRRIKVNVYEPVGFEKGKEHSVYINFHGSGFIIPGLGTDGDFCRIVSNRTGAIVLDCDYAKAPKCPFPAAPEDVKDMITYVLENQEGSYDTSKIAVGGFSTGATLALTSITSQPKDVIKCIIAFYPITNLSPSPTARTQPTVPEGGQTLLSSPNFIKLINDCYRPPGTNISDPRLSPTNVPVTLFPKHVFITTCGYDGLRGEAIALVSQLREGGIDVVLKDLPEVVHGWDKEAKEKTHGGIMRHDSYEAAVEMLKLVFGSTRLR